MSASRKDDSFPYLHLSRRLCLPYADVLRYVELLDKRPSRMVSEDVDWLSANDAHAIFLVWCGEMARRDLVMMI